MKKLVPYLAVFLLILASCEKEVQETPESTEFTKYTILKGEQYCDQAVITPVEYQVLNFKVKFDSTAMYKNLNPLNHNDINKLYGFADNNSHHHEFSARVGWRWSKDSLRLFAYVYNNSENISKEIRTVNIGDTTTCSISVRDSKYIFNVGNKIVSMPRTSLTPKATGYRLLPYFGGDEIAPHEIHIWIKEF